MFKKEVKMKKIILGLAVSASMMGCASKGVTVAGTTGTGTTGVRTPAAVVNSGSIQVDLRDVAALTKGYFSTRNPDKSSTIVGYSAYVLNAVQDSNYGRVIIYLDPSYNTSQQTPPAWDAPQTLVVDNNKFLYSGGPLAGDEPSFAVNRKDSLLIQSGNDGSGRNPWHETVTVALRNGQLVVAGYDFDSYDRLGVDRGINCSVNLLTGKGILKRTAAIEGNGKDIVTNFKVSTQPVLLKDWTEQSRPSGCGLD